MDFLSFIPDPIKKQVVDVLVKFLADQAEKTLGDQLANRLRKLSSEAGFLDAFDKAMSTAQKRFIAEYTAIDEDLVSAITADPKFWQNKSVRKALINMVSHPGAWLYDDQVLLATHFEDVLPHRVNRERVDKAIAFFLRCIVEELWTLPGAKEIREVYSLQAQKLTAEAVMQQVALTRQALEIETQLSVDMRHTLQQLTTALEQRILEAPTPPSASPRPRPYHNLPQPDYTHFVGREREIAWLEQRLSSQDRVWLTVVSGIGGVGKSALALAVAHAYRERYHTLPPEERFEAIVWVSAKSEVLTAMGTEQSAPEGLIVRTLEDIYTTISQTLEREDITRALPDDQDRLVQRALGQQRTLLIVDNLESVTDERVKGFLRNLTPPTKALITSREWIDVAAALKLTGLPQDEAFALIAAEANTRGISLVLEQQQQLFERTFGLPLPIKLAIARLASGETFEQVLRWLGDATGSLPEYCVKGHIEFVRQKHAAAWKLLLACSLFDQNIGASRETLGKIVDLSLTDRDDGLATLLRSSLINRTSADRFWVLPMVQGYAAVQLSQIDSSQFVQPWLDWALEYSKEHGGNLDLHVERIQELGREYANIHAAMQWCFKHELWEYVQQLSEAVWFYSYLVGPLYECRAVLDMGMQAAVNLGNRKAQGWILQRLGRLTGAQGQFDVALSQYLHQAEMIANETKDTANLGRVYTLRSGILFRQNDLIKSRQLAEASMVIANEIDDPEIRGHAIHRLAEIESAMGNGEKSLELLDLDAEWCQKTGWLRQLAWNMRFRAIHLFQKGQLAESEKFFLKSIELTMSWGEPKIVAHAKRGLAEIYYVTGRKSLALQNAEEAADLFERLVMEKSWAETQELIQHWS